MKKPKVHAVPAPQKLSFIPDGSSFFPLSGVYFDPLFGGGICRAARILQKYMAIHVADEGWEGRFSQRALAGYSERDKRLPGKQGKRFPGSTLFREAVQKHLPELARANLIQCLEKAKWRGIRARHSGSLWAVAPAFHGQYPGSFPLAIAPYRAGWLDQFSAAELFLLEYWSFRAFHSGKLEIEIDPEIVAQELRAQDDRENVFILASERTVKRARRAFIDWAILIPRDEPRGKGCHRFFLNPVLVHRPHQTDLFFKDLVQARHAFHEFVKDQNRSDVWGQKRSAGLRSIGQERSGFGSLSGRWILGARRLKGQKRSDHKLDTSLGEHGAPSHNSSSNPAGGEAGRDFETERARMSPPGQDHTPGEKGVGPGADPIPTWRDEMLVVQRAHLDGELAYEEFLIKANAINQRHGRKTSVPKPTSAQKASTETPVGNGGEHEPRQVVIPSGEKFFPIEKRASEADVC